MKTSTLLLTLVTAFGASALAQDFHPISSIQSSTSGTDLWPVSNLIQGPGVGFDANSPNNKLISNAAGNWVTDAPGGFPSDYIAVAGAPVLTIDFGMDQPLNEISVWGYTESNANGASAFGLRFATDADGAGGFGTSIPAALSFAGLSNNDLIRQSFAFNQQITARYVEVTITDNFFVFPGDGTVVPPGGDRVGLGEIAFEAIVIPEPSTVALLFSGLALLGFSRFRKR